MSSPTRRLTTVWFADIAGFTKLSATDEPLALRAMEAMRRCVRASVAAYHGTIIKFLGDGALAEFPSAEGAVEAALEAVARFKGGTKELAGGPYLLHIGIHVGDVTVASDGDLFGDGVNRAARLQSLGQGGQVLVSEDVFRLVRRRAELKFDALGEKTAKELEDPFEVFAVEPNGEMVERLAQMEDDPANRAPAAVQRTRQARVQRVRPSRAIGTGIAAGVVAFVGLALYTAMGGQADPVVVVTPMPDGLPLPIHTASFAMPAWPPRAAAVRQAAATDPAAPAPNTLAGLARRGEAYLARLRGRDMAGHEVLPLLRQALNEARDGAPAGARADVIRAVALFVVEQDGRRSEAAFQQALAADPQAGLTRLLYARLLTAQGRSGEARFQIEQAKGKGVSNAAVNAARGALLLRDGQFRQAQGPLADALDDEDLLSTRILLARALIAQNKNDAALRALDKKIGSLEVVPWMAYARLRGSRGGGGADRARMIRMATHESSGYAGAILLLEAGEFDQAFAALDRLIRARDPDVLWLSVDPEWASLREDPRFQQRAVRVLGTD